MKSIYVFPGTFSPPTYGHVDIVQQAIKIFPEVIIVCSKNPNKDKAQFTQKECKKLWKTYKLPSGVKIVTFDEFQTLKIDPERMVMIRGIRNSEDEKHEKEIMMYNKKNFNITKFFYIFGKKEHLKISSSSARKHAKEMNLEALSKEVSPVVVSSLIEKTTNIKNIFMVVGSPGGGKSTFLKMLEKIDDNNVHINTDFFNKQLKPLLEKKFGKNLIKTVTEKEKEFNKFIAIPWIQLLVKSLKETIPKSNVFVEIPYGLKAEKELFRFLGGKIIYIGCDNEKEIISRNAKRNTLHLRNFINKIPKKDETVEITKQHNLRACYIDTNCSLELLFKKALNFNEIIQGE